MERSQAIEGLKAALQAELNGIEFYRMAAHKTDDVKGKKVFEMLAADEYKHFQALEKQYASIAKNNEWQSIDLGDASVFEGESPIFSPFITINSSHSLTFRIKRNFGDFLIIRLSCLRIYSGFLSSY